MRRNMIIVGAFQWWEIIFSCTKVNSCANALKKQKPQNDSPGNGQSERMSMITQSVMLNRK